MTPSIPGIPSSSNPPICTTINYTACSRVMYHNWNSLFIPPGAWTSVSCCYPSPSITKITIEIAVLDDTGGYWLLDDFSASQGNGQLISNGGFEYNLTN